MKLLENSVPIAGLKADDYDAIYIPGGHGIAVDGPFDTTLRALISSFAASGKIVSAVCHGPIAFSGPEVDGKPIVAGKRVCPLRSLSLSTRIRSYIPYTKTLSARTGRNGSYYNLGCLSIVGGAKRGAAALWPRVFPE